MQKFWPMISSIVLYLAISANLYATPQENCDLPLDTLSSHPKPSIETCESACTAEASCAAYVFISGWNRCFFKSAAKKKKTVVMHGGKISRVSGGEPVATSYGDGTDHRGRDLRKVPNVSTEAICQKECIGEAKCVGYVWLEGYGDCWLKKTEGTAFNKRFYCGTVR